MRGTYFSFNPLNFKLIWRKREFFFLKIFQLFVFTIPISSFVSVRLLFFALLISFTLPKPLSKIWRQAIDIFLYLFVLLTGLFYSTDVTTGFKVLETNFSLLAIPLILNRLGSLDTKIRDGIFRSFLLGVMVASLVCLLYALYRYTQETNLQFFFFETFTETIESHPTYLAYYIIFAITIVLYGLYYGKNQRKILFQYLLLLFLFIILILTGGQTAFISMLFVFSFFILKFLTEKKNRDTWKVVVSILFMLACMFLVSLAEGNFQLLELNDSWERAILWKSAIVANSNFFLGVGTGDYKIALNEYYTTHSMAVFARESYNAHNQFIQLLFSNGLLGLFSLLIMLGRPLYIAVKTNTVLSILSLFPFLIYGITEVFLGRFQGVVFFALLHQIFMTEMKATSKVTSGNKIRNELNVEPA